MDIICYYTESTELTIEEKAKALEDSMHFHLEHCPDSEVADTRVGTQEEYDRIVQAGHTIPGTLYIIWDL